MMIKKKVVAVLIEIRETGNPSTAHGQKSGYV